MSTLNGRVILAKDIKMDRNYCNTLNYNNQQMIGLITGSDHLVAQRNDMSFLNLTTGEIQIQIPWATCLQANYIGFQNPNYGGKWFFAWIDNCTMKSPNNTLIRFTLDIFSTYWGYWQAMQCLVEREHVANDTIGANIQDEEINIENTRIYNSGSFGDYNQYTSWLAINSNWNPFTKVQNDGITNLDSIIMGSKVFLFRLSDMIEDAGDFVLQCNSDGRIESVKDMYIVPNRAIDIGNLDLLTMTNNVSGRVFRAYEISNTGLPIETKQYSVGKVHQISSYQPKNNKTLCYPYNYLIVTNGNGNQNIYRYEYFSDDTCKFNDEFAFCIGGSGKLVPYNYNGTQFNTLQEIPLGKFPTCQWTADSYTNWLSQNSVNTRNYYNQKQLVKESTSRGETTVNTAGEAIQNATLQKIRFLNIFGEISKFTKGFQEAQLLPPIEQGNCIGDVNYKVGDNCYRWYQMGVSREELIKVDNYFSRFGYKVMQVKIPYFSSRQQFNFVKIGDSEVVASGSFPVDYVETINEIFRKGTTIWHNHANIGNYLIDNPIV